MEDNKKENTNQANQPNSTDGNQKPNEPSIDLLTKKAKEEKQEFGAAGHDDINKNLGSFGNTVVPQAETNAQEIKLDVDTKLVEKAAQEKINFERFSKTKRTEKAAKTKLGERISMMLRSKKGLRNTWIIEMVSMVFIMVVSIVLIACLTRYRGLTKDAGEGPLIQPWVQTPLQVGLVFAWISIFPCLIPLIYLITTWFIGINEVAKSRIFHIMFWICGAISLICFIVGFACLMVPVHWLIVYPPF